MVPPISFALVDLTDHSFLNWNLVSWKSAIEFRSDYTNQHNISIVKIRDKRVTCEMSRNANRATKKKRVDLALAQKNYPLR